MTVIKRLMEHGRVWAATGRRAARLTHLCEVAEVEIKVTQFQGGWWFSLKEAN